VGPAEACTEPKVCELDVPVGVYEDVVRLDVPVDETHLVHALHRAHQLAYVEPEQVIITKLLNGGRGPALGKKCCENKLLGSFVLVYRKPNKQRYKNGFETIQFLFTLQTFSCKLCSRGGGGGGVLA
jgi:hypothetical protein